MYVYIQIDIHMYIAEKHMNVKDPAASHTIQYPTSNADLL